MEFTVIIEMEARIPYPSIDIKFYQKYFLINLKNTLFVIHIYKN
jgi:hypothetical protein